MEWVRKNVEKHFRSDITVTFFRHGKTKHYKEVGSGIDEESLTQEGEEQVHQSAIFLAQEIKRKDEVVLIWASPRKRTLQTAHVLAQTLEKYGAYVLKRAANNGGKKYKTCYLLQSPNLTEDFWDQKPEGESFVPLWRELSDSNTLPEGTEQYSDHEERLKEVLEYGRKIAGIQKKHKNCPNIRLISVCHFETVTPVLQQAYGGEMGVMRGKGLEKANYLHINLQEKDAGNIKSIVKVSFGKSMEGKNSIEYLLFDKQNELTKLV